MSASISTKYEDVSDVNDVQARAILHDVRQGVRRPLGMTLRAATHGRIDSEELIPLHLLHTWHTLRCSGEEYNTLASAGRLVRTSLHDATETTMRDYSAHLLDRAESFGDNKPNDPPVLKQDGARDTGPAAGLRMLLRLAVWRAAEMVCGIQTTVENTVRVDLIKQLETLAKTHPVLSPLDFPMNAWIYAYNPTYIPPSPWLLFDCGLFSEDHIKALRKEGRHDALLASLDTRVTAGDWLLPNWQAFEQRMGWNSTPTSSASELASFHDRREAASHRLGMVSFSIEWSRRRLESMDAAPLFVPPTVQRFPFPHPTRLPRTTVNEIFQLLSACKLLGPPSDWPAVKDSFAGGVAHAWSPWVERETWEAARVGCEDGFYRCEAH